MGGGVARANLSLSPLCAALRVALVHSGHTPSVTSGQLTHKLIPRHALAAG